MHDLPHTVRDHNKPPRVDDTSGEVRPQTYPVGDQAASKQAPVPSHRVSRLLQLGRLAGGIAGGIMAEGARRLASGRLPSAGDLLLTPSNANRLAERLSELRGAAMKVGQLLSMEAGEFLPAEFSGVLARLREDAHAMPLSQVNNVLEQAWGKAWHKDFKRFIFRPLAAASIGQVHEAVTRDGRHLAVKIQYPGVRRSIDSDVDNVAALLAMFRIVPDTNDIGPLLQEAKRQLHLEADYEQEAKNIDAYAERLGLDQAFTLPLVFPELTTPEVLAMSFVPGMSIVDVVHEDSPLRDQVAAHLLRLAMEEVFNWGLVQTDANFANYRYHQVSGQIGLLDFGATRIYAPHRVDVLRKLLGAAVTKDYEALEQAATDAGYLHRSHHSDYRAAIISLLVDASEPARTSGHYDFAASDLASRMSEKVMEMRFQKRVWRLPPPDILFLHRKLGGLYLLCTRLRARVDVKSLVAPYI